MVEKITGSNTGIIKPNTEIITPNANIVTPRRYSAGAALALVAALGLVACDGDSGEGVVDPGAGSSPSVTIEQILIAGDPANDMRAPVIVTDPDSDLDSARVFVDGQRIDGIYQITGGRDEFDAVALDVDIGLHTLLVEAFDSREYMGQASRQFEIFGGEPASYEAQLYLVQPNREVVPVVGGEFCLDDVCVISDHEGVARILNLSPRRYQLGFIEGANTSFLVAIGTDRLGDNIFNYFDTHVKLGVPPVDSLIVSGDNKRTLLYWHKDIPMQTIIDIFHSDPGRNGGGFAWNGSAVNINVELTGEVELSQETIDSLFVAGTRGVEWANSVFESVPWEEARTYGVGTGTITERAEEPWGQIIITPILGSGYTVQEGGRSSAEGALTLYIGVGMDQPAGLKQSLHWVEAAIGGYLTGMIHLADSDLGNFFAYFGSNYEEQITRRWGDIDWQAGILDHVYPRNTHFTPTGHDPVLTPPSASAAAQISSEYHAAQRRLQGESMRIRKQRQN